MRRNPAVFAIVVGGLIAGALDIAYAIVFNAFRGMQPMQLLQVIASGLLGSAAYAGGMSTAALGLALHFLMTLVMAAIFYFASGPLPFLARHPVRWGTLYGLVIFAAMNFVVLPLSAFPHPIGFKFWPTLTNLASHLFFVGVPIALATRKARLMRGA